MRGILRRQPSVVKKEEELNNHQNFKFQSVKITSDSKFGPSPNSHAQSPFQMPHHEQKTTDSDTPLAPNRPVTRAKNATTHPGTDAKRVLSNRREPEVIEREKVEQKAKKAAKEHKNREEAARKKKAQHHVEALRAQQAVELRDEFEVPHKGTK